MAPAATGWMRGARASVATLLTLLIATAGHAVGGGHVSSAAVLTLAALALPVGLLATRWQWTLGRAAAALSIGQVGVHVLLSLMAPTTGGYAVGRHVFHTRTALPTGSGSESTAHLSALTSESVGAGELLLGMTPTMLTAHLLATVVTAWLIARGEDALWSVVARLLPVVAFPGPVRATEQAAAPVLGTVRPWGRPVGPRLTRGPPPRPLWAR